MEEFVYFDALCDNSKCQNRKIVVGNYSGIEKPPSKSRSN